MPTTQPHYCRQHGVRNDECGCVKANVVEQAAKLIAHYLPGEDVAYGAQFNCAQALADRALLRDQPILTDSGNAVVDSLINQRDAALAERNRAITAASEWKMRWQQAAQAAEAKYEECGCAS